MELGLTMFNSIVYAMSSIEAVTPPSPKAVGVYPVVSPNLTVFLLTLPLVAVTVRLTGYKHCHTLIRYLKKNYTYII